MGQPPWRALKQAGCLLGILAVLLLIVLPLAISGWIHWLPDPPRSMGKYLRWIENFQSYSLSLVAAAWFFLLGSCFASFLNVVAWRVPRGRSILGHSSCPHCQTRLGPWDNFPIVGWLRNEGRCSTCDAPISPRYLVVEVILGSVFLLVALATLASGGMTLPIRPPNDATGFIRVLFDPKWDLIQVVAGQLCLLLFLFTFALVDLERFPLPRSVLFIGLFTGIGLSWVAPAMFLFDFTWPLANRYPMEAGDGNLILTLLIGTLIGGICGILLNRLWGKRINRPAHWMEKQPAEPAPENDTWNLEPTADLPDPTEQPCQREAVPTGIDLSPDGNQAVIDPVTDESEPGRVPTSFYYGLLLCGLYLGWQSALVISVWVTLLVFLLPPRIEWGRCSLKNANGLLFTACILHLMTWHWMNLLGS